MHSQLRERIRLMRARLDNAAPVAEIRAESQLFVTPAPVCDRLVTLAEISNRDHILEPSAGTGAILRAIRDTAPEAMCDAVEINSGLVRYDILLQYIQELIQQARAMVATGNYDEAVIEHINDNMNDATRQIAAFQSQVQVQQDALLVVDRQMSYMRQQLSARMLSRYQNNYHFGGSTL